MVDETARQVALVLLHESGDEIPGKTVFQKLAYFLAVRRGLDLGFEPYFYGPFSRKLEQEIELLVLSELAKEETTVLGASGGTQVSNTRYELTEEGRDQAGSVTEDHPELASDAQTIASVLRESRALSTRPISIAAKVHFILEAQGLPMRSEEIAAKSRQLGWQVDTDEIDEASRILNSLGLLVAV